MEPSIILLIHTSLLIISSLVNMKQIANQRLRSCALQLINSYPLKSFKALISLFVLPFKMAYFINNFSFFLRKVSLFVCQIRELQCMNERLISRDGVTWI
ncbi:unnamed protein product [Rhizophagus irregularis]|nr:unnamed protein product [Rhizophagus irregularis]